VKARLKKIALAVGLTAVAASAIAISARSVRPPLSAGVSFSQAVYDRNHELLRLSLSSDEKYRVWTPLERISPVLIESTLLQEDRHFGLHPGVNPLSLVRGFLRTYVRADRRVGGSTLTMQLARLKYRLNTRTIHGKVTQVLSAVWLELLYSKKEILEAYLNYLPYGGNIEGAEAASLIFFRKNSNQLNLVEALSLTVIPQNPNRRGTGSNRGQAALKHARDELYSAWKETHRETESSASVKAALSLPFELKSIHDLPFRAPHFVDWILQKHPREDQLTTSLSFPVQQMIEKHVRNYIDRTRSQGFTNAAVILVDRRSQEIISLVGSGDYFDSKIEGQVNGVLAKRSPGSTLKPFLYGLAMDQGLIHPTSMLKDTPMSFGSFDPENFDGDFVGPISAKDALIRSRNLPAVHLASQLKSPDLYDLLKTSGVTRLRDEKFYGLALPLGGAELTMEELARLYTALANYGVLKPLRDGILNEKIPDERRILSPESSFLTMEMLKDNPRPQQQFHAAWTRDQIPIAWKTGTSHGFRDAWAAGIFGDWVLITWIGNFDNSPNPGFIGRDAAGPLFFDIADTLRTGQKQLDKTLAQNISLSNLPKFKDLTHTKVCAISGELPGPHCKHTQDSWFIAGRSPIRQCQIHREVWVNKNSGLRACPGEEWDPKKGYAPEVFEFWPSDLAQLFAQAGMPRRSPPEYEPRCRLTERSSTGRPPEIVSPRSSLTYNLQFSRQVAASIPLLATTDADSKVVYWFANEEFIGKASSTETLLWNAKPGRFKIRVVDQQGRSDTRDLLVSAVQ
jgi:penicillin-binding protein 1C